MGLQKVGCRNDTSVNIAIALAHTIFPFAAQVSIAKDIAQKYVHRASSGYHVGEASGPLFDVILIALERKTSATSQFLICPSRSIAYRPFSRTMFDAAKKQYHAGCEKIQAKSNE